jgi:hypothetical protein
MNKDSLRSSIELFRLHSQKLLPKEIGKMLVNSSRAGGCVPNKMAPVASRLVNHFFYQGIFGLERFEDALH